MLVIDTLMHESSEEIHGHSTNSDLTHPAKPEVTVTAACVATATLLVHVVLESIAMGLIDHKTELYAFLVGVTAHKVFVSFSFGVLLISTDSQRNVVFISLLIL